MDQFENVYVTGAFQNAVDFDPGPGVSSHTAMGSYSIFVLNLNALGDFVWAKSMGGNGMAGGYGISVDDFGQVYLTDAFNATVDFDPGPDTSSITAFGFQNIFVTKLGANGDLLWAQNLGGSADDTDWGIQFTRSSRVKRSA